MFNGILSICSFVWDCKKLSPVYTGSVPCLRRNTLPDEDTAGIVIWMWFIVFKSCYCMIILGRLPNFHTELHFRMRTRCILFSLKKMYSPPSAVSLLPPFLSRKSRQTARRMGKQCTWWLILEQTCNPACLPASRLFVWKFFGASISFSITDYLWKSRAGLETETLEALFPLVKKAAVGKFGFSKLDLKPGRFITHS